MAEHSQTILHYLSLANPEILEQRGGCTVSASTRNHQYPQPTKIRKWADFSWETMKLMFQSRLKDALDLNCEDLRDRWEIDPSSRRIYDENHVTALISQSHQPIVLSALRKTSHRILEQEVEMVGGGQVIMALARKKQFKPDWAGISDINRSDSEPRRNNILPGDSKTSWTWKTADMESRLAEVGDDVKAVMHKLWPLRQLLHYCALSFSRYGYIITDEELFVIRVGCRQPPTVEPLEIDECRGYVDNDPLVDYASIPWKHSSHDALSINLALWFLHILAANNGRLRAKKYPALRDEELVARSNQHAVPRPQPSFNKDEPCSFEQDVDLTCDKELEEATQMSSAAATNESDEPVLSFQVSASFESAKRKAHHLSDSPSPSDDMRDQYPRRPPRKSRGKMPKPLRLGSPAPQPRGGRSRARDNSASTPSRLRSRSKRTRL